MKRHQRCHNESDNGSDSDPRMRCISCRKMYLPRDAGACKKCIVGACKVQDELMQNITNIMGKVDFLGLLSPLDHGDSSTSFTDVVLVASEDDPPIPAHKAILVSRSPVFKTMFENDMTESRSSVIKMTDVSYDVLQTFVRYLYTAKVCIDEQMACDLLIMSEKYQVIHLKSQCEMLLISNLTPEKSLMSYVFAHQHNAKGLLEAALSHITRNMENFTKTEGYMEIVKKDPHIIVEIYEAYISQKK